MEACKYFFNVEVLANSPSISAKLSELHEICFDLPPKKKWSSNVFSSLLKTPGTMGLIALDFTGEALGFIMARIVVNEGELITLCVLPSARRQGVATELFREFKLSLEPYNRIFLEVSIDNKPARKLYQALGFSEVGTRRGYYQTNSGNSDALILMAGLE